MMKVLTVVGARPQFIKAAVLSRLFSDSPENFRESIIHTGQHHDANMSEVFFQEMKIPRPTHSLDIHGLDHGAMTGRMMEGIEKIVKTDRPDLLLIYGDTNSTLAGALVASKLHIPVAHVEAGLRSYNAKMPEEINRVLADRISSLLFCPTPSSRENLKKEGITQGVHVVGDIMADALFYYANSTQPDSEISKLIRESGTYYLATIHRAENTDNLSKLKSILDALRELSLKKNVIIPLHPRTKKLIEANGLPLGSIHTTAPVSYFNMIALMKNCAALLTDSGGAQKEAYLFKKPCVILREETEWTELVEGGTHLLAGSSKEKILDTLQTLEKQKLNYSAEYYGRGDAASKILSVLENFSG